jgi:hypothetical protein
MRKPEDKLQLIHALIMLVTKKPPSMTIIKYLNARRRKSKYQVLLDEPD